MVGNRYNNAYFNFCVNKYENLNSKSNKYNLQPHTPLIKNGAYT